MQKNAFIEKLFARAVREGFEASEAYYSGGEEFEVRVLNGEIRNYSVSSSLGLSFRALIGGKMGYASTQVLDEEAIDLLIDGAKENARLIENEDEQFIFGGSAKYAAVEGFNQAIEEMTAAEKIDLALRLEKAAVSIDPRVSQVDYCMVLSVSGEKRIVNSKGLDVKHRDNLIGMYVSVNAREGERVASGGRFQFSKVPKELDVSAVAKRAVREAVDGLAAKPVQSGKYKLVLRNDVAASMLGCFDSVFSADMAQKGLSLLKGREGEVIAADVLTITDDPLRASGLSSTPFDAEGVATAARDIVEKGRLTTLLHNLKTAKKQGVETTGHASKGSYASPVGVAPTNFFVRPSGISFEQLLARMGDGLLITDLEGLHAGADQISGDFSLGAKGYRVDNGKLGAPVNQITIAGNFFALLKGIEAVGADLEFGFPGASCIGSPSLLTEEMSVAGL